LLSFDRSLSAAKWLRQTVDGRETVTMLSAKHGRSIQHINITISLAFLTPLLVTAAVEGRIPRGVSVRA
jgi:site-specific DNA recombinase